MSDLIYLAIGFGFFALMAIVAIACDARPSAKPEGRS